MVLSGALAAIMVPVKAGDSLRVSIGGIGELLGALRLNPGAYE